MACLTYGRFTVGGLCLDVIPGASYLVEVESALQGPSSFFVKTSALEFAGPVSSVPEPCGPTARATGPLVVTLAEGCDLLSIFPDSTGDVGVIRVTRTA